MIYILNKTILSGSHNAPWNAELGSHWPKGEKFIIAHKYYDKYFGKKAMQQIGGEQVIVLFPGKTWREYFNN